MRYNQLGRTGLFVSELCLGTMTFGGSRRGPSGADRQPRPGSRRQARRAASLAAGINFIDTADVYSFGASEELLGQSLKNLGVKRSDVVIATKVLWRRWATARTTAAPRAATSWMRSSAASSGCRPTISISTRSTAPIR